MAHNQYIQVDKIMREWHPEIRKIVDPREIFQYIRGLTDFDKQQIERTFDREGQKIAADKMVEAIKRRDQRSGFISFLAALLDHGYENLAHDIIGWAPILSTPDVQHAIQTERNYTPRLQGPVAQVQPQVHQNINPVNVQNIRQNINPYHNNPSIQHVVRMDPLAPHQLQGINQYPQLAQNHLQGQDQCLFGPHMQSQVHQQFMQQTYQGSQIHPQHYQYPHPYGQYPNSGTVSHQIQPAVSTEQNVQQPLVSQPYNSSTPTNRPFQADTVYTSVDNRESNAPLSTEYSQQNMQYTSQNIAAVAPVRQPELSPDSNIDDIPIGSFNRLVEQLNENTQPGWKLVAEYFNVKRGKVKELGQESNPAESLLDFLSSKNNMTVGQLINCLRAMGLNNTLQCIQTETVPAGEQSQSQESHGVSTSMPANNQQPLAQVEAFSSSTSSMQQSSVVNSLKDQHSQNHPLPQTNLESNIQSLPETSSLEYDNLPSESISTSSQQISDSPSSNSELSVQNDNSADIEVDSSIRTAEVQEEQNGDQRPPQVDQPSIQENVTEHDMQAAGSDNDVSVGNENFNNLSKNIKNIKVDVTKNIVGQSRELNEMEHTQLVTGNGKGYEDSSGQLSSPRNLENQLMSANDDPGTSRQSNVDNCDKLQGQEHETLSESSISSNLNGSKSELQSSRSQEENELLSLNSNESKDKINIEGDAEQNNCDSRISDMTENGESNIGTDGNQNHNSPLESENENEKDSINSEQSFSDVPTHSAAELRNEEEYQIQSTSVGEQTDNTNIPRLTKSVNTDHKDDNEKIINTRPCLSDALPHNGEESGSEEQHPIQCTSVGDHTDNPNIPCLTKLVNTDLKKSDELQSSRSQEENELLSLNSNESKDKINIEGDAEQNNCDSRISDMAAGSDNDVSVGNENFNNLSKNIKNIKVDVTKTIVGQSRELNEMEHTQLVTGNGYEDSSGQLSSPRNLENQLMSANDDPGTSRQSNVDNCDKLQGQEHETLSESSISSNLNGSKSELQSSRSQEENELLSLNSNESKDKINIEGDAEQNNCDSRISDMTENGESNIGTDGNQNHNSPLESENENEKDSINSEQSFSDVPTHSAAELRNEEEYQIQSTSVGEQTDNPNIPHLTKSVNTDHKDDNEKIINTRPCLSDALPHNGEESGSEEQHPIQCTSVGDHTDNPNIPCLTKLVNTDLKKSDELQSSRSQEENELLSLNSNESKDKINIEGDAEQNNCDSRISDMAAGSDNDVSVGNENFNNLSKNIKNIKVDVTKNIVGQSHELNEMEHTQLVTGNGYEDSSGQLSSPRNLENQLMSANDDPGTSRQSNVDNCDKLQGQEHETLSEPSISSNLNGSKSELQSSRSQEEYELLSLNSNESKDKINIEGDAEQNNCDSRISDMTENGKSNIGTDGNQNHNSPLESENENEKDSINSEQSFSDVPTHSAAELRNEEEYQIQSTSVGEQTDNTNIPRLTKSVNTDHKDDNEKIINTRPCLSDALPHNGEESGSEEQHPIQCTSVGDHTDNPNIPCLTKLVYTDLKKSDELQSSRSQEENELLSLNSNKSKDKINIEGDAEQNNCDSRISDMAAGSDNDVSVGNENFNNLSKNIKNIKVDVTKNIVGQSHELNEMEHTQLVTGNGYEDSSGQLSSPRNLENQLMSANDDPGTSRQSNVDNCDKLQGQEHETLSEPSISSNLNGSKSELQSSRSQEEYELLSLNSNESKDKINIEGDAEQNNCDSRISDMTENGKSNIGTDGNQNHNSPLESENENEKDSINSEQSFSDVPTHSAAELRNEEEYQIQSTSVGEQTDNTNIPRLTKSVNTDHKDDNEKIINTRPCLSDALPHNGEESGSEEQHPIQCTSVGDHTDNPNIPCLTKLVYTDLKKSDELQSSRSQEENELLSLNSNESKDKINIEGDAEQNNCDSRISDMTENGESNIGTDGNQNHNSPLESENENEKDSINSEQSFSDVPTHSAAELRNEEEYQIQSTSVGEQTDNTNIPRLTKSVNTDHKDDNEKIINTRPCLSDALPHNGEESGSEEQHPIQCTSVGDHTDNPNIPCLTELVYTDLKKSDGDTTEHDKLKDENQDSQTFMKTNNDEIQNISDTSSYTLPSLAAEYPIQCTSVGNNVGQQSTLVKKDHNQNVRDVQCTSLGKNSGEKHIPSSRSDGAMIRDIQCTSIGKNTDRQNTPTREPSDGNLRDVQCSSLGKNHETITAGRSDGGNLTDVQCTSLGKNTDKQQNTRIVEPNNANMRVVQCSSLGKNANIENATADGSDNCNSRHVQCTSVGENTDNPNIPNLVKHCDIRKQDISDNVGPVDPEQNDDAILTDRNTGSGLIQTPESDPQNLCFDNQNLTEDIDGQPTLQSFRDLQDGIPDPAAAFRQGSTLVCPVRQLGVDMRGSRNNSMVSDLTSVSENGDSMSCSQSDAVPKHS